ncbi:MAG: hypothetical protein AAF682_13620 [Planctomycetota bacterium]
MWTTSNVGLGTSFPLQRLHVTGSGLFSDDVLSGFGTSASPSYRFGTGSEQAGLSSPSSETVVVVTSASERLRVDASGNVGIGRLPGARLDVRNSAAGLGGVTARLENDSSGGIALHAITDSSDGTVVITQQGSGSILRGFNGGAGPAFEVRNSGRVVTTALEITGGGDLVEAFDATADCPPGTVVVIDPDAPGRLRPSCGAYDPKVAGAVSGAGGVRHGVKLTQVGVLEGDTLVAMTGRVYVRCSVEGGPIRPGDLLTTADLPGHAMRATDATRSNGAVLGKAMTSLDEGTGLVLVLVNLQ